MSVEAPPAPMDGVVTSEPLPTALSESVIEPEPIPEPTATETLYIQNLNERVKLNSANYISTKHEVS